MRNCDTIIIHHTATPASMDIGVEFIREIHTQDNGWAEIGYHFVIRMNGTVETGRDIGQRGAHAKGHNLASIGLALVGTGPDFTRQQWRALEEQVILLTAQYGISDIIGHQDVKNTKCPGFNVRHWWG